MSIELLSVLFVAVFVVVLLTGLPLAFATGAVAVFFALVLFGLPGLTLIVGRVFTLMGNYVLLSVPLFIFMACVLERAGIAEEIFRAAHVWAGRIRGGLAVAVIISCALMAAMVGVIGAEIVTMGVVALPAMLSRGYKKELALGCICAGGGLATLIPPSVVFIMYGLTSGVSIGQLYMAGIVPGLMLAGMYIAYIVIRCRMRPDFAPPASEEELAVPLREKLALLKGLVLPGLVAFSVLGSLYLGWATPTEAAGVGVVGAVVAMVWNGRFSWDKLRHAAQDTAKVTVMLYWLFFGSSALIGVYTLAGGTKLIQDVMTSLPVGPIGVIILIQIVWIILGMFIDWIGILLAYSADLRARGRDPRLRPGVDGRAVLHEHADLLHLAALRPRRLLSQGGHATGHHAGAISSDRSGPTWGCRSSRSGWSSPFRRSRCGCPAPWPGEAARCCVPMTLCSMSCACPPREMPRWRSLPFQCSTTQRARAAKS